MRLTANMIRTACLLAVACIGTMGLNAQTSFQKMFRWTGTYQVDALVSKPDGDMLVSGNIQGNAFVASLDCNGTVNWSLVSTTEMANTNFPVKSVSDNNGNTYLIYTSGVESDLSLDVHLLKIGADTTVHWHKVIGGTKNDSAADIAFNAEGAVVVCGTTSSFGADAVIGAFCDLFIATFQTDGQEVWKKTYGNLSIDDVSTTMVCDSDGSCFIAGNTGNTGTTRIFVLKTSILGDVQWYNIYGNPNHENIASDMILTGSSSVFVCGASSELGTNFNDPSTASSWHLNNTDGSIIEAHAYPDVDGANSWFTACMKDNSGDIVATAIFEGYSAYSILPDTHKAVFVRWDGSGVFQDASLLTLGGTTEVSVSPASDGTVIFNISTSQFSNPCCSSEVLLVKTDGQYNAGCNQTDVTAETIVTPLMNIIPNSVILQSDILLDVIASVASVSVITEPQVETFCQNAGFLMADFLGNNGCVDDFLPFEDMSQGNILTWEWDFGDGTTSNFQDPANNYADGGTYMVTLIISDGCSKVSDSLEVIVDPTPVADAGFDQYIRIGSSATIGIMTQEEGLTYQWSPPSGVSPSNMPIGSVSPQITTNYTLTVSNEFGCASSDNVTVVVDTTPVVPDQNGELYVPNIFSPNEDGQNDVFYVYGGPFTDFSLAVFNRLGERAFSTTDQEVGWDGNFRGRPAPIGAYYYQLSLLDETGAEVKTSGNVTLTR